MRSDVEILTEVRDIIVSRLDAHVTALLDLYQEAKKLPHPYDAVAEYANSLAHDWINQSFARRITPGEEIDDETIRVFAAYAPRVEIWSSSPTRSARCTPTSTTPL